MATWPPLDGGVIETRHGDRTGDLARDSFLRLAWSGGISRVPLASRGSLFRQERGLGGVEVGVAGLPAFRCWPPPNAIPCFATRRGDQEPPDGSSQRKPGGRCRRWLRPCSASAKFPNRIAADALAVAICQRYGWPEGMRPKGRPGRIRVVPAGGELIATVPRRGAGRALDYVVIEAAGWDRRLAVSSNAAQRAGRRPEIFLHAETVSRDDSLLLYGFCPEEERGSLQHADRGREDRPQGPRSRPFGRPTQELTERSFAGDAKHFQALPGIGKRTAEADHPRTQDKVTSVAEEQEKRFFPPPRTPARSLRRSDQPRLRPLKPSSCSTASAMAMTTGSWWRGPQTRCFRPGRVR